MNIHLIVHIADKTCFYTKIKIKQTSKYLNNNIKIYSIPSNLYCKLDNIIIKNLDNLRILYLSYNNTITDDGIRNLVNLRILDLFGNQTITNDVIKNLVNLRKLNLFNNQTITNDGIKNLSNLETLCLFYNRKITCIKHLINLRKIYIRCSNIDENDIAVNCKILR
jgi:Leucine-rich repeat (LRR) protein